MPAGEAAAMLPRGLRQPQQHVPSVVRDGVLGGQERGCLRGVLRGPLLADRALRHGVRGRTAVLQLGGHQPEGAAGQGAHRRRRHQLHAGVCAAKSADVQRLSRASCLPALLNTDEQTAPIFRVTYSSVTRRCVTTTAKATEELKKKLRFQHKTLPGIPFQGDLSLNQNSFR